MPRGSSTGSNEQPPPGTSFEVTAYPTIAPISAAVIALQGRNSALASGAAATGAAGADGAAGAGSGLLAFSSHPASNAATTMANNGT
jgi:hypothetical protein